MQILKFSKEFNTRDHLWLSWLVILGILGISGLTYQLASRLPAKYLIGAVGALILGLIILRNMPLGLTLLVAASATINLSIGTGTKSPIVLAVLLVVLLTAVWILRMLVIEQRVNLVPSELNLPLIVFLVIVLLSWIASYATLSWQVRLPGNVLVVQAGQVAMFILSVAAFLLTANHTLPEKTLKLWTCIIIGIGVSAVGYQVLIGRNFPLGNVKGAIFMWPFVMIFSQLLFNPTLSRRTRILGLLALVMWVVWARSRVFIWKGSWVPALIAMVILLFLKDIRLGSIIGVTGLVIMYFSNFLNIFLHGEAASTLRPQIWWDVIRMGASSILLGLGPANYMYYWSNPNFTSITFQTLQTYAWNQFSFSPPSHNLFVDIFAQVGILGLVFFLWALFATVRLGMRLHKQFKPGFQLAYVNGVFAGFIAMAISSAIFADWLIPFVYNIGIAGFSHSMYSWLLLGTLVSIENNLKGSECEPKP